MKSSTKWMVAIFAVIAGLAVVHFSLVRATPVLTPSAEHGGPTEEHTAVPTNTPTPTTTPTPTPTPIAGAANILLNPGGGNVGIGTFTPTEQLEISGNFRLPSTTATTGIIMSDENTFIHGFGAENFFAGGGAGNLTMTGARNVAIGVKALFVNTTGVNNTATGRNALAGNTTGVDNTATGQAALISNTTGNNNTAIGDLADVSAANLNNATAIGANAIVDASNKIRLGDSNVTVIEGQVPFTFTSDTNLKENFRSVDGEETLEQLAQMNVGSWNYKGHDPIQFRHYGPTAQDFFGTETTINSGDMAGIMMIAIQELAKQNEALQQRIDDLETRLMAIEEYQEAKVDLPF